MIGTLLLLFLSLGGDSSGGVAVRAISATAETIIVGVKNNTEDDIVLLSPQAPGRMVDRRSCTVKLTTRVNARPRPLAFTPTLITLRGGAENQFLANLTPLRLSRTCEQWTVRLEYAYILPADMKSVTLGTEEFRRRVLRTQQVIRGRGVVTVK